MKTSRWLVALALAGSLGSSLAFAQQPPHGGDHGGGPGGPGAQGDHGGPGGHGGPAPHPQPNRGAHGGPGGPGGHPPPRGGEPGGFIEGHRDWHRGDRLPQEYRDRQYVVDDYRAYNLAPPPRGYHWVGVGGDYLLVQISNGIVLRIGQ